MKWVDNTVELVLHIQTERGWIPYYAHQLHKPDHVIPGTNLKSSKGFATAQYLLSLGYKYANDQQPVLDQQMTVEELFSARAEFLKMTSKAATDEEIDNLRCYHKAGQMLVAGMSNEGMIEKLAVALRAAEINFRVATDPSIKEVLLPYFDLSEQTRTEFKMMVRAVLGTLLNEFPALNMRSINHQLEMLEGKQ